LSSALLGAATFRSATLVEACLAECDFQGGDLREANLPGANLEEADLSHANLGWATLTGAELRYRELSGANLLNVEGLTALNSSPRSATWRHFSQRA